MSELIQFNNSHESIQRRLEDFTDSYIELRGDHIEAYVAAGFERSSAKQNARKYLNKNYDFVMARFKRAMGLKNTKYLALIENIAESTDERTSDRLKALDMLTKVGGLQSTDINITTKEADQLSPQERKERIQEMIASGDY